MKNKIILFIVAGLISITAFGQDIAFPGLAGYKLKTEYPVYQPDNLWDFIDGAAEIYLSYDFVDLHVAEYKKRREVIKLEIYKLRNHTMAFGIYSNERSPSFKFTDLGAQGYIADGTINFFKGNYYVKIKTYSKKLKIFQGAETLARKVAGILDGETVMPAMLDLFPPEGKKSNEEIYINQNVLGHNFLNNAFKAVYEVGPDIFSIFIFECSDSDGAGKIASTYIASTGIDQIETGDNKFVITDGYNGPIFLAWKASRIVVISGLAKDQSNLADKYTSEILK